MQERQKQYFGANLGKMLTTARKDSDIERKELASESGLSIRTIAEFEGGGRGSGGTVKKYVQALNVLRKRSGNKGVQIARDGQTWELQPQPDTWLEFPDRVWNPTRHGPGALLTANYRIVEFHGTRSIEECNRLVAWCKTDAKEAIRVYKGEPGMGKTRLAIELCHALSNNSKERWTAGFAKQEHFPETSCPYAALNDLSQPLLVVVDYAGVEENTRLVRQLLLHLEHCCAPKVRLLFLERVDNVWLDRLHGASALRDILHGPLLSQTGKLEALEVPSVANSNAERNQSFRTAWKRFSSKLGMQATHGTERQMQEKFYDSVLFIHIQALLGVMGTSTQGKHNILRHLLAREREYWSKRLKARKMSGDLLPAVEQAIRVFSNSGGVDDIPAGVRLLRASQALSSLSELQLRALCELLRECYPSRDRGIGPLQPDELKDFFLGTFL